MATIQRNLQLEDLSAFDLPYTKDQLKGIFLSYDFIGYFVREKIAGLIIFKVVEQESTLIYIEILEAYRQQGIAKEMMSYYHRLLGPAYTFLLEVSTNNHQAIKLYTGFGYQVNRLRKNYYEDSDGWEMILHES